MLLVVAVAVAVVVVVAAMGGRARAKAHAIITRRGISSSTTISIECKREWVEG